MLKVIFADSHAGVSAEGFEVLFSYVAGGPVSFVKNGKEWLYRAPQPTFWRALTDNDRGNGFALRSGMWYAADRFIRVKSAEVSRDGEKIPLPVAPENNRYSENETAHEFKITYVFETITVPVTEVRVSYTVTPDGRLRADVHYAGKEGLPELPVFGLRMIFPTAASGYTYEGLSGETYPDRKAGGIHGIYEAEGLPVNAYLTPQDCGMHMDTEWVEIRRNTVLNNADKDPGEFSLKVQKAGKPFAFSLLPHTPAELENAGHAEELPPVRRTVLTVCGAVRGVGGIDSWGSDVEDPYRINAEKDIDFSFEVC